MRKKSSVILLFIAAVCIICISACKKDNSRSNPPGSGQSFTPTYIAPTQSGHIQVSVNTVTLHPGESALLSASLFTGNGTLVSSQPSFIWSVDRSAVASVSGGTVTALATGTAEVAVTDGSHGVAYVLVSVVASSQALRTTASSISFTPPTIIISTGQSAPFAYHLYNLQGQSVSGTVSSFYYDIASGLSITGTSVTAGSVPGVYTVGAIIGSDTLSGLLTVVVGGGGSAQGNQTTYAITGVYYPSVFNDKGLTAAPVRITVMEKITDATGAVTSVNEYQTSPDQITVLHPQILSNSGGVLTSLAAGFAKLQVTYKGVSTYGWSSVRYKLKDSWGNADVCLTLDNPDPTVIEYWHTGVYSFALNLIGVNYHFTCEHNTALHDVTLREGVSPLQVNASVPMAVMFIPPNWDAATGKLKSGYYFGDFFVSTCPLNSFVELTLQDDGHLTLTSSMGGNSFSLSRGGCVGLYQNTYSQFGASTSNSGLCFLSYLNTTVSGYISNDNILNDSIFFNGHYIDSCSNHFIFHDSFEVRMPILLGPGHIWSGSTDLGTDFHFQLDNGTLNADSTQFTGTITVTSPNSYWATITKNITLNR